MIEAYALRKFITVFVNNFNDIFEILAYEILTNDVVSFEQPDPDLIWSVSVISHHEIAEKYEK